MLNKIKLNHIFSFILLLILPTITVAQNDTYLEEDIEVSQWINGSLMWPEQKEASQLAILISDYGPTDRNGNQNAQKNYNILKLAEALAKKGIASYRYDKRTYKQIKERKFKQETTFDDFVFDAKSVVSYFKALKQFKSIYIIGHGQGSLVGMLASKDNVDGFISIAGSGKNIGDVIVEQTKVLDKNLAKQAQRVVDALKRGETVLDYPPVLASVFDKSIQPFMRSWMAYTPTEIISKLNTPILVVNGTNDLQVSVEEAKLLAEANSKAQFKTIENMNHVLFEIEGDDLKNSKSYNEGFRVISNALTEAITAFMTSLNSDFKK